MSLRSLGLSLLLGLGGIISWAQAATYAVIVGINEYRSASLRPLRYAEADALLIREILTDYLGVPEENIRLLLGSEATRKNIAVAIKGWLAERAGPGDVAFFYFSGHGTFARDADGDEEDGRDELLSAYDSGLIDITFVRDDDLNRWLSQVRAGEKIVMIDACHSGTGSKGIFQGDNRVKEAGIDWYSLKLASSEEIEAAEREIDAAIRETVQLPVLSEEPSGADGSTEAIEFAACAPDEVSMEVGLLKHGLFTYYAAEGIRGAADQNGDEIVSFSELHRYVLRRIRSLGFPQTPQLNGILDGNLPFVGAKTLLVEPVAASAEALEEEEPSSIAPTVQEEATPSSAEEESSSGASFSVAVNLPGPSGGSSTGSSSAPSGPSAPEQLPSASPEEEVSPQPPKPELPPVLPPERVLAVEDGRVRLNIGTANGVLVGAIYRVYPWRATLPLGGKVDPQTTPHRGELRIVEAGLSQSVGEVLSSSSPIEPNDAVLLYQRPVPADELVVRVLVDPEANSPEAESFARALDQLLTGREEGIRSARPDDIADRLLICRVEGENVQVTLANPQLGLPVKEVLLTQTGSQEETAREVLDRLLPSLRNAYTKKMLAALENPESPIRLRLKGPTEAFIGETISLELTPNVDAYILVIDIATDGSLYVLYPNAFEPEPFVRAGQRLRIPDRGWRIRVAGPPGTERVQAIASTEPFDFGGIDLEALAQQRIYALPAEDSGRVIRNFAVKVLRNRAVSTWGAETIAFTVSPPGQSKDPVELYTLE